MEDKYKRKQGERVWFDILGDGKLSGFGKICGSATEEQPTIGRAWIVEVESPNPIDANIYPFSHISVFDCQIKEPPNVDVLPPADAVTVV